MSNLQSESPPPQGAKHKYNATLKNLIPHSGRHLSTIAMGCSGSQPLRSPPRKVKQKRKPKPPSTRGAASTDSSGAHRSMATRDLRGHGPSLPYPSRSRREGSRHVKSASVRQAPRSTWEGEYSSHNQKISVREGAALAYEARASKLNAEFKSDCEQHVKSSTHENEPPFLPPQPQTFQETSVHAGTTLSYEARVSEFNAELLDCEQDAKSSTPENEYLFLPLRPQPSQETSIHEGRTPAYETRSSDFTEFNAEFSDCKEGAKSSAPGNEPPFLPLQPQPSQDISVRGWQTPAYEDRPPVSNDNASGPEETEQSTRETSPPLTPLQPQPFRPCRLLTDPGANPFLLAPAAQSEPKVNVDTCWLTAVTPPPKPPPDTTHDTFLSFPCYLQIRDTYRNCFVPLGTVTSLEPEPDGPLPVEVIDDLVTVFNIIHLKTSINGDTERKTTTVACPGREVREVIARFSFASRGEGEVVVAVRYDNMTVSVDEIAEVLAKGRRFWVEVRC